MKAVVFAGAGGNEVVRIEEREDPVPADDEVLVRVAIAGMNPADLHQREGHYPAPPGVVQDIPGLEVAGIVIGAGSSVTRWREGDAVFGLVAGGGLADRVVVAEASVTAIPPNLSDEEAAAVPEAFITAHDALRQASLRDGDTVFVRGSTGAVGSAAVQIARAFGNRVVTDIEGAGSDGVDVAIELLGGNHVADDLVSLNSGGRIVVVSVATGARVQLNLLDLMSRRATILGTVLRARSLEEKARAVEAFADRVVPLLASGSIRPSIDSVWGMDEVHGAFDRLGQRGKRGKVLLRVAHDMTVGRILD